MLTVCASAGRNSGAALVELLAAMMLGMRSVSGRLVLPKPVDGSISLGSGPSRSSPIF